MLTLHQVVAFQSPDLAAKTLEHAWLILVGQVVIGLIILIGSLAVGKRFLSAEFPGVIREIREDFKELRNEIEGLRRDFTTFRGETATQARAVAEQARDLFHLDRRVSRLEGDATGSLESHRTPGRRPERGG